LACLDCGDHPAEVRSAYLAVTVDCDAQPVIVRLRGELDVSNVAEVRGVFDWLLSAGPQPIVVDLSGLSFADCGGMSVLVAVRNWLEEQGHDFKVTSPHPGVRRLLAITGMDTLFRVGEDEHHAARTRTDHDPTR
jgi:anti-sigma B factor antagonist